MHLRDEVKLAQRRSAGKLQQALWRLLNADFPYHAEVTRWEPNGSRIGVVHVNIHLLKGA